MTGMRPTSTSEHLSEILRKDEYFGQYGKIIKIVVSKAKDTTSPNPAVGVYVTFETKEAAEKCIKSVDGTSNYDTRLRAQYGTTKYCSAYLRGDTCGKKDCMFLHEPGDENESFSRQDLSSMNVISTQSPAQANMPAAGQPPQPQPPPQQTGRPIAAASQTGLDDTASQADSADGSGLPPSASWATKPTPSRKASQHQSAAAPPMAKTAPPLPTPSLESRIHAKVKTEASSETSSNKDLSRMSSTQTPAPAAPARPRKAPSILTLISQELSAADIGFSFDEDSIDAEEKEFAQTIPLLFDPNGALRRRVLQKLENGQTTREADNQVVNQALSAIDPEESTAAGSLQLGGEPEDGGDFRQRQQAIRPPSLDNVSSPVFGVEQTLSPASNPALASRGMTPAQQHQQNLLLQSFKSGSPNYLNQGHTAQGTGNAPGHARQTSRYSFANDINASANVKPVASQKLMHQQNSMLPSGTPHQNLAQQQGSSQIFSSGVQGPPPGLKATGTPTVSGGGMFGQGHGFATAGLNYGVNTGGRNANDDMMRELLRNRGASGSAGQASDPSRREPLSFTSPIHSLIVVGSGLS